MFLFFIQIFCQVLHSFLGETDFIILIVSLRDYSYREFMQIFSISVVSAMDYGVKI